VRFLVREVFPVEGLLGAFNLANYDLSMPFAARQCRQAGEPGSGAVTVLMDFPSNVYSDGGSGQTLAVTNVYHAG
jgi:hypothetical protein